MVAYFSRVFSDSLNILKGLNITFWSMWKPSICVQYPTEKLVPYPGYRGALIFDVNTCIGCNLCVKACPSKCIDLQNSSNEAGKKIAQVDWYTIDFGKCNWCRLCEEACPTKPKSVWHSRDYEVLFESRDQMVRSWRRPENDDYWGVWYDPKDKEYKAMGEHQVPIHTTPERIGG